MADINQRIVLTGSEEVRRGLDAISAAGQRAGNQTRASLLAATGGATSLTSGTGAAAVSAGQLRFALQNLSFQANDVATSLASGGSAMRVFAQQGGQVFQAFQQGGGIGTVLGAARTAISNLITPARLAAVGAVALAAGFGAVIISAESSQDSIRQFDVVLKAVGKSTQTTGKQLEDAAHQFKDVGLTTAEGRKALNQALTEGVNPNQLTRVVRVGAELNTVLGEGSLEQFIAAAGQGGAPLEAFAKRLGIVTQTGAETVNQFQALDAAIKKTNETIADELRKRSTSLLDNERETTQQIKDLTRVRGTDKQELELASRRRIEQINRDSDRSIVETLRQFNQQRADENAKALADYNKQTLDAAQKAANDVGLIAQIEQRVTGATRNALGPLGKAILDARVGWDALMQSLANSAATQALVSGLATLVTTISDLVKAHPDIAAFALAVAGLTAALGLLSLAFTAVTAAASPWLLAVALVAAGVLLIATNWGAVTKALGDGWNFIKTAFDDGVAWVSDKINGLLTWLQSLIDKAKAVAAAIGSVFGGGGPLSGDPSIPASPVPAGNAAGGMIRGPGTSTSDSILRRLSNGEFVFRAAAVQAWGAPLLASMNAIGPPIMPQMSMPRGFAGGGLVTAGAAGGTPVHLHLGSRSFELSGESGVVDELTKHARSRGLLSAGRAPGWVG